MELDHLRVTVYGNVKTNPAYASFEHLKPRRDGGGGLRRGNIVLAHIACNVSRDRNRAKGDPRYAHDPLHKMGSGSTEAK